MIGQKAGSHFIDGLNTPEAPPNGGLLPSQEAAVHVQQVGEAVDGLLPLHGAGAAGLGAETAGCASKTAAQRTPSAGRSFADDIFF